MLKGGSFSEALRHLGVRPTALRLALLETLASEPRAFTAGELLGLIRRRRRVNKVTVYRLLEEFTGLGLARRVATVGKAAHYELAGERHPDHPHFQCRACGAVHCLEPVPLAAVWSALKGTAGIQADCLEIRVAGLCRHCRDEGGRVR
jgi:Fur family ferric uptake transcriptional regulator